MSASASSTNANMNTGIRKKLKAPRTKATNANLMKAFNAIKANAIKANAIKANSTKANATNATNTRKRKHVDFTSINQVNTRAIYRTPLSEHTDPIVVKARTEREHAFRQIETEFKKTLARIDEEMEKAYKLGANNKITTNFEKKIKDAETKHEMAMEATNIHYDNIIQYKLGLTRYNQIEKDEQRDIVTLLQKHAAELKELSTKKDADKELPKMLESHKKQIQDLKILYENLRQQFMTFFAQFRGGRRKSRSKRHNKTRRCKKH